MVIDDTGSVKGIYAFIYCTKWRFGQVLPMPDSLTHSQRKDRATQLFIKYKSGALVTQFFLSVSLRMKNGEIIRLNPKYFYFSNILEYLCSRAVQYSCRIFS